MYKQVYNLIKSISDILPLLTLSVYAAIFLVLFSYFSDKRIYLNEFSLLDVKDYITIFAVSITITIFVIGFVITPPMIMNGLVENRRTKNLESAEKYPVIVTFGCIIVIISINIVFAAIITSGTGQILSNVLLKTLNINQNNLLNRNNVIVYFYFALIFIIKNLFDYLFNNKIKAVVAVIVSLCFAASMMYPGAVLKITTFGNYNKFIVFSKKPDNFTSYKLNVKKTTVGNNKIYYTDCMAYIGLVTKDNILVSMQHNNTPDYCYLNVKNENVYMLDSLPCHYCHKCEN